MADKKPATIHDFNEAYMRMFDAVIEFYRFPKRYPEAIEQRDPEYYAYTAEVLKKRIDLELAHLNDPSLP